MRRGYRLSNGLPVLAVRPGLVEDHNNVLDIFVTSFIQGWPFGITEGKTALELLTIGIEISAPQVRGGESRR